MEQENIVTLATTEESTPVTPDITPSPDIDTIPQMECLSLKDTNDIEIYGDAEQRTEMFGDWALYIGEVTNPTNTKLNPYTKSMYAPLDEVLNATRPVLSKHGFGVFQTPFVVENKVYVKTLLTHKSGTMITFPTFSVPVVKADAQGVIAGVTYARRGGLNPILGTHGEADDDGNTAAGKKPEKGTDTDEALTAARNKVLTIAKQKSETVNKDAIYAIIQAQCKSKNPNALKSVEDCNTVIEKINAIKEDK